jgi:hypothetical protein
MRFKTYLRACGGNRFCDLLFKAASETMLTIAADPKDLGANVGITAVLHTWGSAMTHHPHVHMGCGAQNLM